MVSIALFGDLQSRSALHESEREEALERSEGEEHADGESWRPGDPVPEGTIDHGDRGVCGIVENADGPTDAFTVCDELGFLEANNCTLRLKFDDGQVHDAAVPASRAGIAMRVNLSALEADDFALRACAIEEEMHVSLASEVGDGKQSYRDEK